MSKRRTNPAESAAQGEVLCGLHSVLGVGLDTFTTISCERKRGPERGLASERASGERRQEAEAGAQRPLLLAQGVAWTPDEAGTSGAGNKPSRSLTREGPPVPATLRPARGKAAAAKRTELMPTKVEGLSLSRGNL